MNTEDDLSFESVNLINCNKDLYELFVLFLCPGMKVKAVAVLLFLLALIAQLTSGSSVFLIDQVTALDTFSVSVGVIFVHEADEAVRYFYDGFFTTKRPGLAYRFVMFIVCYFVLFALLMEFVLKPVLFSSEQ